MEYFGYEKLTREMMEEYVEVQLRNVNRLDEKC